MWTRQKVLGYRKSATHKMLTFSSALFIAAIFDSSNNRCVFGNATRRSQGSAHHSAPGARSRNRPEAATGARARNTPPRMQRPREFLIRRGPARAVPRRLLYFLLYVTWAFSTSSRTWNTRSHKPRASTLNMNACCINFARNLASHLCQLLQFCHSYGLVIKLCILFYLGRSRGGGGQGAMPPPRIPLPPTPNLKFAKILNY